MPSEEGVRLSYLAGTATGAAATNGDGNGGATAAVTAKAATVQLTRTTLKGRRILLQAKNVTHWWKQAHLNFDLDF